MDSSACLGLCALGAQRAVLTMNPKTGPSAPILASSNLHQDARRAPDRTRLQVDAKVILAELTLGRTGTLHLDVRPGAGAFDVLDQLGGAIRTVPIDLHRLARLHLDLWAQGFVQQVFGHAAVGPVTRGHLGR